MKTRLFISVATDNKTPNEIAEQAARVVSSFNLCANVHPMYSAVHVTKAYMNRVEPAAHIDILGPIDKDTVLDLWGRLQSVLGIHCVWLDYADAETPSDADYSYSGCICEWAHYIAHFDHVGHDVALTCSCADEALPTEVVDDTPLWGVIYDVARWEEFKAAVPKAVDFDASPYYLHKVPSTETWALCLTRMDDNIAIVNSISLFTLWLDK